MIKNKEIALVYCMEMFSGLAYGSYLGCIGWSTLVITNSVATVGQIFIVQAMTMMLAGPVVGVIIDRYKRKHLIMVGQMFISIPMLSLGILLFNTQDFSTFWLFLAVFVASCARILYRGSFDGIIRAAVDDDGIIQTVARAGILNSLTKAGGMAGIGIIIDQTSVAHGFIACAIASALLLCVACFLADGVAKTNTRGLVGYLSDFKEGLKFFKTNKNIQTLAVLSAVTLPIGQLTNALLSSFVRDDLGQGSDFFGMVDAGWAIGGMVGAALISMLAKKLDRPYTEYLLAVLAGGATIVFSFSTELLSMALLHGAMGFFVWSCRIIIGGRVIRACSNENVGRTRVYMEVMVGATATLMCLSPTAIALDETASYFLYWGMFIVASASILWLWKWIRAAKLNRKILQD
jgi:MFS family permease